MSGHDDRFSLLILDDDDALALDAAGLQHPRAEITLLDPSHSALALDQHLPGVSAVVVCLDSPGRLATLAAIARRPCAPPVIAIAAHGVDGHTLEHTLLMAELRGARLALPKPIDAAELLLACLTLVSLTRSAPAYGQALAADLESRLGW